MRRAFWIGEVDARIPALLRTVLGVILLSDVFDRMRDLFTFFTDLGAVPRGGGSTSLHWTVFALSGQPAPVAALFLLGVPIAVAYTVGYRTRVASILAWVYLSSVMNRNPYVNDGGDSVLRLLLFWSMFVDLGARYSLDCWLGRRAPRATVPAIAVRCLQVQIAIIYLFTIVAKTGVTWRDGTAVRLVLENPQWSRGLGPLIARSPAMCKALSRATLVIEAAFPLLVFSPWRPRVTRATAIILGTALHLGIFLTIRVGLFSVVMPASYVVFVAPEWIDWVERRISGPQSTPTPSPVGPSFAHRWTPHARRVGLVLLALTFIPMLGPQIAGAWSPPSPASPQPSRVPAPIASWLAFFSLEQSWRMFSPDAPQVEVRWIGPGALADGRAVDVIAAVAPGLGRPTGFAYTRWHKLANNLVGQSPSLMRGIGAYLCRRYNGDVPGPKLERFDLQLVARPVESTAPPEPVSYFRQRCAAESKR